MSNFLKLTNNSKTKFSKNHLNTFGLNYGLPINGGTCPGATKGEGGCLNIRDGNVRETCYMVKITQIYKGVGKVLQENTSLLKGKSKEEMVEILTNTINEFIRINKGQNLFYRLHYSGDFFSEDYTKAWATTINKFPNVKFWVYTRSHSFVKHLVGCKNLAIYISIDPANLTSGYKVYETFANHTNVGIAFMGNNVPEDRRWVQCPEITGKVKNTPDYGACSKCQLCFTYTDKIKLRNIQFPIH